MNIKCIDFQLDLCVQLCLLRIYILNYKIWCKYQIRATLKVFLFVKSIDYVGRLCCLSHKWDGDTKEISALLY